MARYIFSDIYAATVLPIVREIHREILACRGPAIDRLRRATHRALTPLVNRRK
jgi:hypothetical protein